MFSVIIKNRNENENNIFKSIKKFCRRKSFYIDNIDDNGIKFYVIRIENYKYVDWREIEFFLGRTLGKVIFEDDFIITEEVGIDQFNTSDYDNKLTQNGIGYILKKLYTNKFNSIITLIDFRGRFIDYANIIAKYSHKFKVITNRIDFYSEFSEKIAYNYGNSVIVTPIVNNLDENNLVICPDCNSYTFLENLNIPIISSGKANQSLVYSNFQNDEIKYIEDYIPKGIDIHRFKSALYSCCNIKSIGDCIPKYCYIAGKRVFIDDIFLKIFNA
ncbi:MAG: hypothetical protein KFW09_03425 [Oscillospiraceae bacterium]|nr:hypothetical protein [Oscillospiraceae bacterium]